MVERIFATAGVGMFETCFASGRAKALAKARLSETTLKNKCTHKTAKFETQLGVESDV